MRLYSAVAAQQPSLRSLRASGVRAGPGSARKTGQPQALPGRTHPHLVKA